MDKISSKQLAQKIKCQVDLGIRHECQYRIGNNSVRISLTVRGIPKYDITVKLRDGYYQWVKDYAYGNEDELVSDIANQLREVYLQDTINKKYIKDYEILNKYEIEYDLKAGCYYIGDKLSSLRVSFTHDYIKVDGRCSIKFQGDSILRHYINEKHSHLTDEVVQGLLDEFNKVDGMIRSYSSSIYSLMMSFMDKIIVGGVVVESE